MAVELSLGLSSPGSEEPGALSGSIELWAFAVEAASEPCVLLDLDKKVVVASPGCGQLFSFAVADAVGRELVEVLQLLDFSASSASLPSAEADRIPPLMALGGGLARGLLRVRKQRGADTVDAIAVPLRDGQQIVGSLTFFAAVNG